MRILVGITLLIRLAGPVPAVAQTQTGALWSEITAIIAEHPDAVVAVSVRDPHTGTRIDLQGDRLFHAASTMKVAVMMAVFRQVASGYLSLSDSLLVENRFRSIVDGSEYAIEDDSDDAIYRRLGSRMSIKDLVYQMITVSSNLATNLLIQHTSADSAQAAIDRLGNRRMRVLRGVEDLKAYEAGLSNRATSADLALQMEALMSGSAIGLEADSLMVGILLDQRFDEMIPAGLPADVRVAHKTGQITRIHHDAAIVYPLDSPPYVLIVLIEGIADEGVSAALGARIAAAVHARLRPR